MRLPELLQLVLPKPAHGSALARGELRTVAVLAPAILAGGPFSIAGADVAHNLDRFLAASRSRRTWRCRTLLVLIEHVALATHGARLSRLPPSDVLDFVTTRLVPARGVFWTLAKVRHLVVLGAYADPRAEAGTGFVPVLSRPRFRPRPLSVLEAAS